MTEYIACERFTALLPRSCCVARYCTHRKRDGDCRGCGVGAMLAEKAGAEVLKWEPGWTPQQVHRCHGLQRMNGGGR